MRRRYVFVVGKVLDRQSPLYGKVVEVAMTTKYKNKAVQKFEDDARLVNVIVGGWSPHRLGWYEVWKRNISKK